MSDLSLLYKTIDELNADQLEATLAYIRQRRAALTRRQTDAETEARINALHAAVADFWEDYSADAIDEIIADMNSEQIPAEDASLFDWVDRDEKDIDGR
ncbi:MAG: hypothetical protein JW910_19240 [Anaerolineae bacterium]|nr:hypothetical protein [Anaerolineae bacterium]